MVQHGAICYNMVQHGAAWCNMVQYGATRCNMVQQGAKWCNMVQLGARWCMIGRLQRDQEFSIPGFFGTGLVWNFMPGFYQKSTGYLWISLSANKFGQFHKFWRTYLFVNYIRQAKVSPIQSCGKQQERAGVQCCWQSGDPKKSLTDTRESRSLSYCQIQPW